MGITYQVVMSERDVEKEREALGQDFFDSRHVIGEEGKFWKGKYRSERNGKSVKRWETSSGKVYEVFRDKSAHPL